MEEVLLHKACRYSEYNWNKAAVGSSDSSTVRENRKNWVFPSEISGTFSAKTLFLRANYSVWRKSTVM